MCCSRAAWKREVVPDHKFDFIDVRDYHTKNFGVRAQYLWIYVLVLKSFVVYIADIYTAVTMLSSDRWTSSIYEKCPPDVCVVQVSFQIGKWIFVGCILFSFLLLAYESRKAKKIVASRDISYAFTNVMANNYYSLRSYDHFCFFCQIENSTKKKDDFAFFIFFTFKGWKRLLLADGPRQSINGLTLYSFWLANGRDNPFENLSKYYNKDDYLTATLLFTMLFTVIIFAGSLILLIIAAIFYVPLLCYIRGNLKEYCCHKVDKRISELIKKKTQQRVARNIAYAKKEAAGDYSHLKNKKGEVQTIPQPTLPNVSIEPENPYSNQRNSKYDDSGSFYDPKGGHPDYAPNAYGGYPADPNDYPPMPVYTNYPQYFHEHYPPGPESLYSYDERGHPPPAVGVAGPMEGDYGSTVNLAYGAAPPAGHQHDPHYSAGPQYDDPADQYALPYDTKDGDAGPNGKSGYTGAHAL